MEASGALTLGGSAVDPLSLLKLALGGLELGALDIEVLDLSPWISSSGHWSSAIGALETRVVVELGAPSFL